MVEREMDPRLRGFKDYLDEKVAEQQSRPYLKIKYDL